jgi:uncharacterized protein (TIGR00299 family) protein
MKIAYVDMIGGVAGDMLLGAWIDAGADRHVLERALRGIVADGWTMEIERVARCGISALHVDLVIPGEDDRAHVQHGTEIAHVHDGSATRSLADVLAIVARSALTPRQVSRASAIYRRLAEAEARIHGGDVDTVHFHEVGQIDAILDVAGTCVALDLLGIDEVRVSPFPAGTGLARMHHGIYPNPGPATLDLLRGWPLRALELDAELVTTTGAAILTTLATSSQRVDMTLERTGYGAGRKNFPVPNVVRVLIGTVAATGQAPAHDTVAVIEANIDDMSPQQYELALERVFAAGAVDAWLTPIVMKKGRPAITLSAIAPPPAEDAVARAILRETTTIGVRVRTERRVVLPRVSAVVDTPYGPVRVKRVDVDGRTRARAEYDDLVRIAREHELPLDEVARVVDAMADEKALS